MSKINLKELLENKIILTKNKISEVQKDIAVLTSKIEKYAYNLKHVLPYESGAAEEISATEIKLKKCSHNRRLLKEKILGRFNESRELVKPGLINQLTDLENKLSALNLSENKKTEKHKKEPQASNPSPNTVLVKQKGKKSDERNTMQHKIDIESYLGG